MAAASSLITSIRPEKICAIFRSMGSSFRGCSISRAFRSRAKGGRPSSATGAPTKTNGEAGVYSAAIRAFGVATDPERNSTARNGGASTVSSNAAAMEAIICGISTAFMIAMIFRFSLLSPI